MSLPIRKNSLCYYCRTGDLLNVKRLIEQKPFLLDKWLNTGSKIRQTPLLIATTHGHVHVVKYLIQQNAHMDYYRYYKLRRQNSPLHYAVDNQMVDVVRELLKHDNISFYMLQSVLRKAVRKRNVEIIRMLVFNGGAKVHAFDSKGLSALNYVDSPEVAAFLLNVCHANPFCFNDGGFSRVDEDGFAILELIDTARNKWRRSAFTICCCSHNKTVPIQTHFVQSRLWERHLLPVIFAFL